MVPPRPLQTTPTPSSGTLKGASRPPPRLAPPEKSGLIKARTISPIGGNYVCCFYGMIGGGSTPGAASPHSGRFRGVTGGLEGPKGGDSESPLGPPRNEPPRQGIFASLCKRDGMLPSQGDHKGPPLNNPIIPHLPPGRKSPTVDSRAGDRIQ